MAVVLVFGRNLANRVSMAKLRISEHLLITTELSIYCGMDRGMLATVHVVNEPKGLSAMPAGPAMSEYRLKD
jgi:hypothetical protein